MTTPADPHTPPRDVSKRVYAKTYYRPDAPDSPYLSRIMAVVREEFAQMVDEPEMDALVARIVERVGNGT